MREAFKVAKSGKPGPVLIDLPLDVQKADIDFDIADYAPLETATPAVDMDKISEALELIKSAKNPVIVMGGGVVLSGATKECIELAECMQIPVIPHHIWQKAPYLMNIL